MNEAKDYEVWLESAKFYDNLPDKKLWKETPASPDYDYKYI